jgi:SAM-dependent methyltransferase
MRFPEQGYAGPFVLRRCDGCGVLFNSPRLDDQGLSRLYGSNYYFFDRTDAYALRKTVPMFARTVALTGALAGATARDGQGPKRVLDIGCGRGYFPALLRALGHQVSGVELSAEAADYARRQFGLDIFTGTIEQFANQRRAGAAGTPSGFDLVTAIDVIEHVPDPGAFIAAAAEVLEPGGQLIIDTPNADAANIGSLRDEWPGFNPFHIYLFTPASLGLAAERAGLSAQRVSSYRNRRQRGGIYSVAGIEAWTRRQLKRLGLIRPAARTFFAIRRALMPKTPAAEALGRAAAQAAAAPPFDATPDATAPLAARLAGDNLLLIARKN